MINFRRRPDAGQHIDELIDKRLIHSVFQPVVDLRTGAIFSQEALARSDSPHFKNPLDIFAAAVARKRTGELGRMLRGMAVDGCPDYPLFLNVHPTEFGESWLVRPDDPIFLHDQPIYIEITESVPISHYEMCHGILAEIRGKGIGLAVDDLGAGYSNLKYIADLSPEVVKLDRELVAGLRKDTRLHKLVRAMVRLCEDLGAKVVCEGIETAEELEAVIDTGTHLGQGYYLARPAAPAPTVSWRP